MVPPPALLAPFLADPATAGVFSDFDGTLSPIVDDPATARPLAGVRAVLTQLAARYAVVAVVSGRAVDYLEPLLPEQVVVSGLYGLEQLHRGVKTDLDGGGNWREVIEHVAAASRAQGPAGMLVESKGLSLTFHFRTRPELADEVAAWAALQASRSGLSLRAARMSFELHPPLASDKGSAIAALATGLRSVLYVGDDLGDLPAYAELDRLADAGATTVKVAVASDEAPAELLAAADLVVDGPPGALDVLRALAPA